MVSQQSGPIQSVALADVLLAPMVEFERWLIQQRLKRSRQTAHYGHFYQVTPMTFTL